MDNRDKIIERAIDGLNEAIGLIKAWHGMGMPAVQGARMWNIYNTMSPEMKRLNDLLAELSCLREPKNGIEDSQKTEISDEAIEEADRICLNCKYNFLHWSKKPCINCQNGELWEKRDGLIPPKEKSNN